MFRHYFCVRFTQLRAITASILNVSMNVKSGTHLDAYEQFGWNLVWRYRLLNSTFWYQSGWPLPWFKVTDVRKIWNFCANLSHKNPNGFGRSLVCCWDFLAWLISFFLSSQYSREQTTTTLLAFNKHLPTISFKLDLMIDNTAVYIFTAVWMTLTFMKRQSGMRKQRLLLSCSCKFPESIFLKLQSI